MQDALNFRLFFGDVKARNQAPGHLCSIVGVRRMNKGEGFSRLDRFTRGHVIDESGQEPKRVGI